MGWVFAVLSTIPDDCGRFLGKSYWNNGIRLYLRTSTKGNPPLCCCIILTPAWSVQCECEKSFILSAIEPGLITLSTIPTTTATAPPTPASTPESSDTSVTSCSPPSSTASASSSKAPSNASTDQTEMEMEESQESRKEMEVEGEKKEGKGSKDEDVAGAETLEAAETTEDQAENLCTNLHWSELYLTSHGIVFRPTPSVRQRLPGRTIDAPPISSNHPPKAKAGLPMVKMAGSSGEKGERRCLFIEVTGLRWKGHDRPL